MVEQNETTAFHEELRRLCKGRGMLSPDFTDRLGPALIRRMRAAGLGSSEQWRRNQVAEWLASWLESLPTDLELVARVALGLHPDAGQRFLGERIGWLATRLERDERTVRRRIDEALRLLAEFATAGTPAAVPGVPVSGAGERRTGWYFETVRTVVRLDLPEPEILELRRIAVTAAELRSLVIAVSVPAAARAPDPELFAEMVFGGLLVVREHPSKSLFRFVIEPPRPLCAGDRHDLALKYSFPRGQRMVPHYAHTPLTRCDGFRLRVRFSLTRPPERVWRLDGVPPRTLDDPPAGLAEIALDRAAEVQVAFENLATGHAYGLRWKEPET